MTRMLLLAGCVYACLMQPASAQSVTQSVVAVRLTIEALECKIKDAETPMAEAYIAASLELGLPMETTMDLLVDRAVNLTQAMKQSDLMTEFCDAARVKYAGVWK